MAAMFTASANWIQLNFHFSSCEGRTVLWTLEFILQQAAYHAAKPQVLSQQLQQLELDEDKVKPIVEAWSTSGRDTVSKLRQRTIHPKQLEEVNWRLNLQMAQSSMSKMKLPNAMFEFGVKDENSGVTSLGPSAPAVLTAVNPSKARRIIVVSLTLVRVHHEKLKFSQSLKAHGQIIGPD
ncbi:hypothetical protein BaRGS_00027117 [Batillaria attramentaria]|uniref:COMM domain-containing protein n=1 Tax=Batillaria attramentaria TaxID=370345 RepID=A0ABD0K3K2_9CAEN